MNKNEQNVEQTFPPFLSLSSVSPNFTHASGTPSTATYKGSFKKNSN